jgi:hypothetical protein
MAAALKLQASGSRHPVSKPQDASKEILINEEPETVFEQIPSLTEISSMRMGWIALTTVFCAAPSPPSVMVIGFPLSVKATVPFGGPKKFVTASVPAQIGLMADSVAVNNGLTTIV